MTMTMIAPAKAQAAQGDRLEAAKAKARTLHSRLLADLDLIFEAQGDKLEAASIQAHWDRLEAEYRGVKRAWAKTPKDLDRCPDCPNLGRGIVGYIGDTVIICDNACRTD